MNKILKLKFMNWWSTGHKDFFRKFIENYIGIKTEIVDKNADILFFSVFYKESPHNYVKNNPTVKLKIFFAGEDTVSRYSRGKGSDHYYLNFADICLGFKYLDCSNYIRFPLWLTYINLEKFNMGKSCLPFNRLLNFSPNKTNKFCCLLANHDSNNTRTNIVKTLNNYKLVTIGGGIFKYQNKDIKLKTLGCGKGESGKQLFLNNFKFNICSESSINPGYISEKIFECIIGGCIPIYNCKDDVMIESDILNNNFIIKYNDNNYDEVLKKVIELDSNPELFKKFVAQEPLAEKGYENIIKYYDQLKHKFLEFL